MAYILVKYEDDWADEIDIQGFRLFSKSGWEEYLKAWEKDEFPCGMNIGSNQRVEWNNFDELKQKFTVTEVSEEFVRELKQVFGENVYYGKFPY